MALNRRLRGILLRSPSRIAPLAVQWARQHGDWRDERRHSERQMMR